MNRIKPPLQVRLKHLPRRICGWLISHALDQCSLLTGWFGERYLWRGIVPLHDWLVRHSMLAQKWGGWGPWRHVKITPGWNT